MNQRALYLLGVLALGCTVGAGVSCAAEDPKGGTDDDDTSSSNNGGAGSGGEGGGFDPTASGGSGGGSSGCTSDPSKDDDGDGFIEPVDCNDCDANVNPGAVEVIADRGGGGAGGAQAPADEDCNGMIDDVLPSCDSGLDVADSDPLSGAKAIGLCQQATQDKWGLVSAAYVRADGNAITPLQDKQWGIMDGFGPNVNVQEGERMLGLSSGFSRLPGQPGACTSHACSNDMAYMADVAPPGYPQAVPNCAQSPTIYDDVAFEVKIRAPKNATGYRYLFKFYSFEFAEYVCTQFNDQFIALVTPPPMGANNGNISFDSMNNPVSVNIAFFDVCDPVANADFASVCSFNPMPACPPMPNPYCPSGPADLMGNGFDNAFGSSIEDAGATSWLQTTAPIGAGEEFTIRFAIWDAGDQGYDSTVLIDAFEWIATPGVNVGTGEIPDPK